MFISLTLSAWSIFIALAGVSLNAIFTKPFPGVTKYGDERKKSLYNRRRRIGTIANILIVIGTAGQLASIIIA